MPSAHVPTLRGAQVGAALDLFPALPGRPVPPPRDLGRADLDALLRSLPSEAVAA